MNKSISQQLSELREIYLQELEDKKAKYSASIAKIEEDIESIKNQDFSKGFTNRYETSLKSLERMFSEVAITQKNTKGISFRVGEYIDTLSPSEMIGQNVEEWFNALVSRCRSAIIQVSNSATPEDDIEPLKDFCQCLVDLRYIVRNEDWLIEQGGLAEKLRDEALDPLYKEKAQVEEEYQEEIRPESLRCYQELMSFKKQVVESKEIISKRMLGNQPITPAKDYKFLVGFYKTELDSDLAKFAEDVLSLSQDQLSQEPIYFDLSSNHSTILINASKNYFKSEEFMNMMSSIYFSFATGLPSRELRFAGIEFGTSVPVIGGLIDLVKPCFDGAIVDELANDSSMFSLINKVKEAAIHSATKYFIKYPGGIFEYNQAVPENRDPFIFLALNHYPCDFTTGRERGYESLKEIATEYGRNGVICVICQEIDGKFNERLCPMLTAEELNADLIEIADNKQFYNKKEAVVNICLPEIPSPDDCWAKVEEYLKSAPSLWLDEVIKKSKEKEKKAPIPSVDEMIMVPLGNENGDVFYLSLEPCTATCHGLIIGGTGSGKSSFLHTLILSTANRYTPEEVRFCLADFKSGETTIEFSHYLKCEKENLYLPHVEYLMTKGDFENVYDVFERIDKTADERARLLNENGVGDVVHYNESQEVVSGKKPRLPYIFYVIDEYNVVFAKATRTEGNNIAKKLGDLLKKVRSAGIGIILSGQNVDVSLDDVTTEQINTRISLGKQSDSDYARLMKVSNSVSKEELQFITAPGLAILTTNSGRERKKVRLAFSGATGCEGQKRLAKEIRERYGDYKQIEGGSEELYPIQSLVLGENLDTRGYFKLPIGVGSASMVPVYLEFSKSERTNYLAYANEDKLFRIERGALFGFLDMDLESKGRVMYLGFPSSVRKCLSKYFEKIPALKDSIDTYTTEQDMADQIARLYALLKKRKNRAKKEYDEIRFEPILAVMHQVDWLVDKDTSWFDAQQQESTPHLQPRIPDEVARALEGKSRAMKFAEAAMLNKLKQEARGGEDPKKDFLTVSDYRDALIDIFNEGTRFGIYLLICSPEFKQIESAIRNNNTNKIDTTIELCSVFGSSKEKVDKERDINAPERCAYVSPKKIKTRLFNFSTEENKDWWSRLEAKLKKGF